MLTIYDVANCEEVKILIQNVQKYIDTSRYKKNFLQHINDVSKRAGEILESFGYPTERIELAKIAGYMYEIGNCTYGHFGALLVYDLLKDLGMSTCDRLEIMMAICVHDEKVVSDISAALSLADKLDVYKNNKDKEIAEFEVDDRLNYAILDTDTIIDSDKRKVVLNLTIDTKICTVLECFEIFMNRIQLINCATDYLGTRFELIINDTRLL